MTNNDELKQKMLAYLEKAEGLVEQGADQVPLVAQEYLAWCWWKGCIQLGSGILIFAFGTVSLVLLCREMNKPDGEENQPNAIAFGVGTMLSAIFSPIYVMTGACTLLKIHLAPRVFLLEKIAELVK